MERIPIKIQSKTILVESTYANELADELDTTLVSAALLGYKIDERVRVYNKNAGIWKIGYLFEDEEKDRFVKLEFHYNKERKLLYSLMWSDRGGDVYSYSKGETIVSPVKAARFLL